MWRNAGVKVSNAFGLALQKRVILLIFWKVSWFTVQRLKHLPLKKKLLTFMVFQEIVRSSSGTFTLAPATKNDLFLGSAGQVP